MWYSWGQMGMAASSTQNLVVLRYNTEGGLAREGFATPVGLRHWGLRHSHAYDNNTHSVLPLLLTSLDKIVQECLIFKMAWCQA